MKCIQLDCPTFLPMVCIMICASFAVTTGRTLGSFCDQGPCGLAQMYNPVLNVCTVCEDGTFMDELRHQCVTCKPCSVADPYTFQVMLQPCTNVSDAVIGCMEGHFKMKTHGTECERCGNCPKGQLVISPCGGLSDVKCGHTDETSKDRDDVDSDKTCDGAADVDAGCLSVVLATMAFLLLHFFSGLNRV